MNKTNTSTGEACCGNCESFDFEDAFGNGICLENDSATHCSSRCACHTPKTNNQTNAETHSANNN